jgi:hypothetical protein
VDKVYIPCDAHEQRVALLLGTRLAEQGLTCNPHTVSLVARFAGQLAAKLAMAEAKHGYGDGWMERGHAEHFRAELRLHVDKGDPTDVAAYCAFLWHHGDTAADPAGDGATDWMVGALTADVIEILGRPNFACRSFADMLRLGGQDIPPQSEREQAATLHYLLGFYATHGAEWRQAVLRDVDERQAKAAAQ